MKHLHILGICGTFMAGVAILATEKGYRVTGADANVYPPMSTQLEAQGIALYDGYAAEQLASRPDAVIIGNALSRGKQPVIEAVLNEGLPYYSGPQWIAENILADHHVLAVAGTHGKTTTTSMLAWILEYAGLQPGFLIGGIPKNFGISARLGSGRYFVIEADEYDSAFFDKRPKFLHYRPRTLILNNLEFDHADIFPDLAAIQQQCHYLLRTVPAAGQVIVPSHDANIQQVLQQGCWTPISTIGIADGDWQATLLSADGSHFSIRYREQQFSAIQWPLLGQHNIHNALAAIAAAHHIGIDPTLSLQALQQFQGVKRRLECRGEKNGITVYEDFAHHPTAIATTLAGLRAKIGGARLIAVIECASNTMRMGVHRDTLAAACQQASHVIFLRPQPDWGIDNVVAQLPPGVSGEVQPDVMTLLQHISSLVNAGDVLVLMSNGGFGGLPEKLLKTL